MSFYGDAVGDVNNAILFQVNGVTGGTLAAGTITNATGSQGMYNAPSVMPMTGSAITITVVSQADPTKTSSATVTLQ